jgi:predicted nuclease of restriction endonuclease-like RecB superfamily
MHVTALNTAMQEATKTESQLADMRTVNIPEVLRRYNISFIDFIF